MSEENTKMNSIVGNFFYGEVEEDNVFPYPHFTDEQKEFAREMTDAVNRYCTDSIDGEKMDEEAKIPDEVIQGLAELGLCGMGVSEELGGLDLDYSLYS